MRAFLRQSNPGRSRPIPTVLPSNFVILDRCMFLPVLTVSLWTLWIRWFSFDPYGTCSHGWWTRNQCDIPIRWGIRRWPVCTLRLCSSVRLWVVFCHQAQVAQCTAVSMAGSHLSRLWPSSHAREADSENGKSVELFKVKCKTRHC